MQATFKIRAEELNESLISQIKQIFKGKSVTIIITSEIDETDYLLSNPANKKHLMESIASEPVVNFSAEGFEKHAEELIRKAETDADE